MGEHSNVARTEMEECFQSDLPGWQRNNGRVWREESVLGNAFDQFLDPEIKIFRPFVVLLSFSRGGVDKFNNLGMDATQTYHRR
jgi:hypothetical protein